jgi:DivIVA domain-containing protein
VVDDGDLWFRRLPRGVVGYISSAPDFFNQSAVLNGASDLFGKVWGDAGKRACSDGRRRRTAEELAAGSRGRRLVLVSVRVGRPRSAQPSTTTTVNDRVVPPARFDQRTTQICGRGGALLACGRRHTGCVPIEVSFLVVLRGYDRAEVDAVVRRVNDALESGDPRLRATVREELRNYTLSIRLRGYDRFQVDEYLRQAASRLA